MQLFGAIHLASVVMNARKENHTLLLFILQLRVCVCFVCSCMWYDQNHDPFQWKYSQLNANARFLLVNLAKIYKFYVI